MGIQSMRRDATRFRLLCAITAAPLVLAQTMAPRAWAQSAPPPAPTATPAVQQAGDPPERVGQLAAVHGTVSYHGPDADQWSSAGSNYPVVAGDSFWTQPNASAQMAIGSSRVAMNGGAELDVGMLDYTGLQATLPQGEVYLHTRDLAPNESWSIQTPRGLVMLAAPGRYDIAAGDTQNPTTVTVLDGSAQVSGPGVELHLGPGQTATITGADTFAASIGPAQSGPFLTAMVQAEHPPQRAAMPAAVAQMPGGADLAAYGTWSQTTEYGEVWYPQVAPGWVPYSEGYWAYVAPWGWTWIDNEPWAFAPMHYGRWVEIDGRWGWTPGEIAVVAPPIYAPALVTFFSIGVGVGVAVGLGAALAEGSIGWCPLGPHEAYRPWYHVSDRYWHAVNAREVNNITVMNRTVTINNFVNRRAMTIVPASALASSRPIGRLAEHVDPRTLAAARPVFGRDPVRPTAVTAGVTPRFAQQMHLAAAPGNAAPLRRVAAPGPALGARMAGGGRPTLRGPVQHVAAQRPEMPLARGVQPAAVTGHPMPEAHAPTHMAAVPAQVPYPAPMHVGPARPRIAMPQAHPAPRPQPVFHAAAPRAVFHAAAPRPAFHAAAPRPAFHAAAPRPAPHPAPHRPEKRP
jgi:hypothetical protein